LARRVGNISTHAIYRTSEHTYLSLSISSIYPLLYSATHGSRFTLYARTAPYVFTFIETAPRVGVPRRPWVPDRTQAPYPLDYRITCHSSLHTYWHLGTPIWTREDDPPPRYHMTARNRKCLCQHGRWGEHVSRFDYDRLVNVYTTIQNMGIFHETHQLYM
jgi:hypothetical protein